MRSTPNGRHPLLQVLAAASDEECEFIQELLEGFCDCDEDVNVAVVATSDGSRVAQGLLHRLREAQRQSRRGVPCA